MNKTEFVPSRIATKILGVHYQTLYRYEEKGLIETIRTPGGKRLYNIKKYLNDNTDIMENKQIRRKICYCRVSTHGQKDDLENQIKYMKEKYPEHEMITDIGSGINFKRKGLRKIIEMAMENEIEEIVVAYKDKLCRIGYELIEYIIKEYSNGVIKIDGNEVGSPEEEVVKDLLEIITVFSARVHGLRGYKKIIENDSSLKKQQKAVKII